MADQLFYTLAVASGKTDCVKVLLNCGAQVDLGVRGGSSQFYDHPQSYVLCIGLGVSQTTYRIMMAIQP